MALTVAFDFWIRTRSGGRIGDRGLHRVVCDGALLGDASFKNCGADPGDGVDSSRDGRISIGNVFRRGINCARGLVSGHDVDGFGNFQHARIVS